MILPARSSYSEDAFLEAFNMAEGLAAEVDLFVSKLSKPDKLDDREVRLNNLTRAVSSIEESVNKLERDASVLDSNLRNTDHFVSELKDSFRKA